MYSRSVFKLQAPKGSDAWDHSLSKSWARYGATCATNGEDERMRDVIRCHTWSKCQVLAHEGALEELPYISPSPEVPETAVESEEGAAAADTSGGAANKSDGKATGELTVVATGEGGDDQAAEGEWNNATTGSSSSSGQTDGSRVRGMTSPPVYGGDYLKL